MLIDLRHLQKKYNLNIKGIFHIGAHECEERNIYRKLGVNNVFWVEAMESKIIFIKEKFPQEKIIHAVVGDKDDEEVTFNMSNNGQSSSILELGTHKQAHPEVHYIHSYKCRTKKLETIVGENQINMNDINFMNLDIQGAELRALKGMEKYLDKVDYIYSEVNEKELYIGCALISELDEYLSGFGFKRVEIKMCGNTGWGDAFYIKS